MTNPPAAPEAPAAGADTVFSVLLAISATHLLNDTVQALIPALYPVVKQSFALNFTQVGLITLVFQLTASLLQPAVGLATDRRPQPYLLVVGMGFSLAGLLLLAFAPSFGLVLAAVALTGAGSAVLHPESSRVAYLAAGRRRGLAQSIFQVGGNAGSSLGPLLAALVIGTRGRGRLAWFALLPLLAMLVLSRVGRWSKANADRAKQAGGAAGETSAARLPRRRVLFSVGILLVLIFSKYFYMASITSFFTFYLMDRFQLAVRDAQLHLFLFSFAVASGTFLGGPLGDRIGRKYVIWLSILGAAPFTLLLPHVGLGWTMVLSILIGLILSSAFSAILVYAQELIPGKVGLISGLFFGFAFGMGGIGSAVLGRLADQTSIAFVYRVCAFLPLLGLVTAFLPNMGKKRA
ncbi:MAG: Fosmidomycin resistance protein [Spirochaetes bacterium GWB1_66_5]|nr:MAG: Fosmidomycin resistance protein [Spirochaetes bacterium GWB1_66_5]